MLEGRWKGVTHWRVKYSIKLDLGLVEKKKKDYRIYLYIFVTLKSRSSLTIEMSNCQTFSSDWHQELGNWVPWQLALK